MGRRPVKSEEIKRLLSQGMTPYEIVKMGYSPSTVYLVFNEMKKKAEEVLRGLGFNVSFNKVAYLKDGYCIKGKSVIICKEGGKIEIYEVVG